MVQSQAMYLLSTIDCASCVNKNSNQIVVFFSSSLEKYRQPTFRSPVPQALLVACCSLPSIMHYFTGQALISVQVIIYSFVISSQEHRVQQSLNKIFTVTISLFCLTLSRCETSTSALKSVSSCCLAVRITSSSSEHFHIFAARRLQLQTLPGWPLQSRVASPFQFFPADRRKKKGLATRDYTLSWGREKWESRICIRQGVFSFLDSHTMQSAMPGTTCFVSKVNTGTSSVAINKATPIGNYVSGPPPACIFENMTV